MSNRRTPEELSAIASFVDALPVSVWVGRAPSGECVYVNQEFERMLGIRPPEDAARGNYVGPYGVYLPSGEVYPESQMPFERVMRARAPVVVEDLVIHRHDGARIYLRVFASPMFDEKGEITYVVESFTDRTREVDADAARVESERQLQGAQRLESIGAMAGGIAHDFNNLLGIVTLVASNLRQNEQNPLRLELIGHLEEVSESAARLTRSLLGFARRGRNRVQPSSLNETVKSVVELASRTFEPRFVIEADLGAAPDVMRGDSTQVEQVVMNLMVNARDAIADSGRISVRTRREQIAEGGHVLLAPGNYLVLEVEDTGAGISAEVKDRIFEPYVTTKLAGTLKGTGMGLATVYGIAKGHGGHAEIASTSPSGTCMRVWFLASDDVLVERAPTREAPSTMRAPAGIAPLLIVDDEVLILKATSLALKELGYQVLTATSGEAAVELARNHEGKLCGVLLDIAMPGMTSRAALMAFKELCPKVPVILMTGSARNEEAASLMGLGPRSLLTKPFSISRLSSELSRMLEEDAVAGRPSPG